MNKIPVIDEVISKISKQLSIKKKIGFIYIDLANAGHIKTRHGEEVYRKIIGTIEKSLFELYNKSILNEEDLIALETNSENCFLIFLMPSSRYIFAMKDLRLNLQRILYNLKLNINELTLSLGIKNKVDFYSGCNFIYSDPLVSTGSLIREAHKEAVLHCRARQFILRFINNISHEFRTPLTSLKGYTETLLDGAMAEPETCENFLKIINFETNRLVHLISELLDLSLIKGNFVEMNFQTLELKPLILKAVSLIEPVAENKNIKLVFSGRKTNNYKVRVDGDRIVQVIISLLDNAIRYSHKDSVVKIALKAQGEYVRIEVIDRGCGVPARIIPRLFDIFERSDEDRSLQKGGRGVGLAIAKAIVENHGGIINAESEVGKGSIFYFLLLKNKN